MYFRVNKCCFESSRIQLNPVTDNKYGLGSNRKPLNFIILQDYIIQNYFIYTETHIK